MSRWTKNDSPLYWERRSNEACGCHPPASSLLHSCDPLRTHSLSFPEAASIRRVWNQQRWPLAGGTRLRGGRLEGCATCSSATLQVFLDPHPSHPLTHLIVRPGHNPETQNAVC